MQLTRYTKEIVQKQCRDGNVFFQHIESMCRLNIQLAEKGVMFGHTGILEKQIGYSA